MCGRYSLFAELGDLASQWRFDPAPVKADYRPSWNIAPTSPVLAIHAAAGQRHASIRAWGFPFQRQANRTGQPRPIFNARSETIAVIPMFKPRFVSGQRCLIPANGFYEWQTNPSGNGKKALWIHRNDEETFTFAGLYRDGTYPAVTVVTTAPNALMTPIHHRMPVILDKQQGELWIKPDANQETLLDLLSPREWPEMAARTVSSFLNHSGNNGPQLITPAAQTGQLF